MNYFLISKTLAFNISITKLNYQPEVVIDLGESIANLMDETLT